MDARAAMTLGFVDIEVARVNFYESLVSWVRMVSVTARHEVVGSDDQGMVMRICPIGS